MQKKASHMMDGVVMPLEMDSPLKRALEVFKTTGFAFVPIVANAVAVSGNSQYQKVFAQAPTHPSECAVPNMCTDHEIDQIKAHNEQQTAELDRQTADLRAINHIIEEQAKGPPKG